MAAEPQLLEAAGMVYGEAVVWCWLRWGGGCGGEGGGSSGGWWRLVLTSAGVVWRRRRLVAVCFLIVGNASREVAGGGSTVMLMVAVVERAAVGGEMVTMASGGAWCSQGRTAWEEWPGIFLGKMEEEDDVVDINPLFDEVLEDIKSKDSYVSKLDEPALLVAPLSDTNEDECFDPGGDIDVIDAFLAIDVSKDFEDDYYDSEGDIIYLENLLIKDTISNLSPEVFFNHEPKCLTDEPEHDNLTRLPRILKTLVLVVLSIVHSILNPSHAYIWESDILDLID
ncbi:hypothetical protein Tco_0597467 [Tanacetum coccineum]